MCTGDEAGLADRSWGYSTWFWGEELEAAGSSYDSKKMKESKDEQPEKTSDTRTADGTL